MFDMENTAPQERRRIDGKRLAISLVALGALLVVIFAGSYAYGLLRESAARAQLDEQAAAHSQLEDGAVALVDYNATVYSSTGEPFTLTRIAGGKPLVINFWATWCPYCINEMSDYQTIYDEYADRVSFAFIDCVDGQRETTRDGYDWLQENDYDLPDYYDTKQEASFMFGASSLPTTAIVSAEGEILAISAGQIDAGSLRSALDSLL